MKAVAQTSIIVTIYEPNGVNPYGQELARVLAGAGITVGLFLPRDVSWIPMECEIHKVLGVERNRGRRLRRTVDRLLGPLRVTIHAWRVNSALIVVWIRDPWDAMVFCCAAKLGVDVVVVHHNPRKTRSRRGLSGMAERWLIRRASRVVCHSPQLATEAAKSESTVMVVGHPSYRGFVGRFADDRFAGNAWNGARSFRLLFVGQLRRDKGVDELASMMEGLTGVNVELVIAGQGTLPQSALNAAERTGVRLRRLGDSTGRLTDDGLARALAYSDLLVAPYVDVTESASLTLALSARLPALGYENPAFRRKLTRRSLTPAKSRALSTLIKQYIQQPWETYAVSAADLDEQCLHDWRVVLESFA